MKNVLRIGMMAASLVLVASCGGGGGGGDSTQQTGVFGRVVDVDGNGVSGARVAVGSGSATTDAQGRFALRATAGSDVASVTAEGYVPTFAPVTVFDNAASSLQITLLQRVEAGTLTIEEGGSVVGENGAGLVAPANAFVGASGPVTGTATVYLTAINPTVDAELAAAPGDFTGTVGGEVELIESFGMMDVTVVAGDEELNIADGATVEVRFPAPDGESPAEIALWSFDEDAGRWVQEGTATLDSETNTYTANIGHLSWWNCDQVLESTCGCGRAVDDEGEPIAGARVSAAGLDYNGTSYTTADEDGRFCIAVRKDSEVSVLVSHAEGGGLVRTVTSGNTDTDVPPEVGDAGCADWGDWEAERGVVEFPDGSVVDCGADVFPLNDCAPTFSTIATCYNPQGACTVSGLTEMVIEYANGARMESRNDASSGGTTSTTTYYGPGGVECGSQSSQTTFGENDDDPVTAVVTSTTSTGASGTYSYTFNPNSSDIVYGCEDGSTFTLTEADQQVLEACYGGGEGGEGGTECTRTDVTPGTACTTDGDCGSLTCCQIPGAPSGYCLDEATCSGGEPECVDATDCGGNACCDGYCADSETCGGSGGCASDSECGTGEVCCDGPDISYCDAADSCFSNDSCTTDAECGSERGANLICCIDGTGAGTCDSPDECGGGDMCTTDDQCQGNLNCCTYETGGQACALDVDCARYRTCEADSDCGSGLQCCMREGTSPYCDSDINCYVGTTCSTAADCGDTPGITCCDLGAGVQMCLEDADCE
jgi:hypothetical protein